MENNFNMFNSARNGGKVPLYPNEAYDNPPGDTSNGMNFGNMNNLLPLLLSSMQGGGLSNDALKKMVSQSGMDKNPLMQMFSAFGAKNNKKGSPSELPSGKAFPKNETYS